MLQKKTQKQCIELLEKIRWDGVPICPYCGSTNSTKIKKENRYHCNSCFNSYSVTVNTLFHKTHVDLSKWFTAISLVLKSQKNITVLELAAKIQVNKNTASYMITRICKAMSEEPELLQKLLDCDID
ncbi:transposase [Scytonema sp. UIC 10036]|uniref:transposase n=1 Tax=Scytonema sp. UIC 10036 TaxID=2304196 RepID=UPI0012DA520E|nr:transposase [Scytonema sp. UIC 10036]MUG91504.1 transposase [Scytonema sp. UIC 10036]